MTRRGDRVRAAIALVAALFLVATGLSCSSGMDTGQNPTSLLISTSALGMRAAGTLALTQGQPRQVFATAIYADGNAINVSSRTFWSAIDEGCARVGPDTGLVLAAATVSQACTTSVMASYGALSSSATVIVTPGTLQTIDLTPSTDTPPGGSTLTFTAMGSYGGISQPQDITDLVTWHNDNPAILTLLPGSGDADVAPAPGQIAHVYASFIGINSQTVRITIQ